MLYTLSRGDGQPDRARHNFPILPILRKGAKKCVLQHIAVMPGGPCLQMARLNPALTSQIMPKLLKLEPSNQQNKQRRNLPNIGHPSPTFTVLLHVLEDPCIRPSNKSQQPHPKTPIPLSFDGWYKLD